MVFGIIPECRSESSRIQRSASPESPRGHEVGIGPLSTAETTGKPLHPDHPAADSILDHAAKAIEIEDIEARVSELERAAEASKNSSRR